MSHHPVEKVVPYDVTESPSDSSVEKQQQVNVTEVDHLAEKKLLQKIDRHLLLPVWIIFLFGFLDRINLGNAAVLGIVKELKLTGNKLNVALQVFFVPYILLEIPSNILLRNFKPSTWIASISFFWGLSSMCQGFVKNNAGLIACRVFIGVFEAGFVPGVAYLMATWYKRHEFQKRFSAFWCAGLVAGAVGGLLAYGLEHMNGTAGYSGWRWIFIIEGIITVAVSIPMKFLIADWPETARFLTEEEKLLVRARLAQDLGSAEIGKMDRLDGAAWKRILLDWKVIVGALMYIGITTSGYATALFVPTIVNSLGYSGISSQVHSIPVWAVSAVVTLATSVATDRMRHRYGFIMFGVVFASIGYIILLCQGPLHGGLSVAVRYMAVFFVTTGCYIVQPVAIVWLANNLSGHYKRAIGIPVQVGFGNIGGIIASNVFVRTAAPRYFAGYGTALALIIFCGMMATVLAVGLTMENRQRDAGKRDYRLRYEPSKLENLGDDDPRFRFTL